MGKSLVKIGNAGGYWGDDPDALERQIFGGKLDYVSMDFLAEITMSILQKQRARDPKLGYARDFLTMLEKVFKKVLEDKTKIITNAGGVHPEACAEAVEQLAKKLGLKAKIAVVYGDDILTDVDALRGKGCDFKNMETHEDFSHVAGRLEAANAYFGAAPVVAALKHDPDILVTGRVTDTGITLAPLIHEFGWSLTDWDKLAAGIIAGHMLECGAQVTGGNFTDWRDVKSFTKVGFPIAEVKPDATFTITKHPGTGGMVTTDTVREQVFYEMGDPKAYITPDVVADFSTIKLEQDGTDRVKVSGIKGYEPTPLYKVSMAYQDGFKSVGSIIICGPHARDKAETFSKIFWNRLPNKFLATETEYFGFNGCHRSLAHRDDGNEILLRLGARATEKEELHAFGKLIPSLILSGPPGVAVTGGVPKPQEVVSYWPALMPKTAVYPKIGVWEQGKLGKVEKVETITNGNFKQGTKPNELQIAERATKDVKTLLASQANFKHTLQEICLGRSGDKGDTCNIGVMARSQKAFDFLDTFLTAQLVKDWFQELCFGNVVRYRLPGLLGFNFLLESALGGGGTMTMRSDAQGKTFAQGLLRQRANIPDDVLQSVKKVK